MQNLFAILSEDESTISNINFSYIMATQIITIPKKLSKGEDLVIIRKRDFEAFRRWQEEVQEALRKVERGRKEYRRKKTVVAPSPRVFR